VSPPAPGNNHVLNAFVPALDGAARQDIAYGTPKIRRELRYVEEIDAAEAMNACAQDSASRFGLERSSQVRLQPIARTERFAPLGRTGRRGRQTSGRRAQLAKLGWTQGRLAPMGCVSA
jgi:hypothetical protein